ncbi:protein of unknown function,CBS domain-containing protein [Moritella yayanosii]|uniref:Uncharacterized protein n=1 Tax=Moritella yayanosii TaxID=69539 RepID=A0A330LNW3_9GAMM|nr:protein of unknown function,CBS domain-containing protein [Moritella yayanosii]
MLRIATLLPNALQLVIYRNDTILDAHNNDQVMLYIVKKEVLVYYNERDELQGKFSEGDLCSVLCRLDSEALQIS